MAILKNIDVAKKFNISPATVKNWIDYARQDKFQLDLSRIGERYFIKDTPQNIDRLSKLKSKGVKYRSKTGYIEVSPSSDLYKIYNEAEIIDIMNHLKYHHYIPIRYFFFEEGARWKYEGLLDFIEANKNYKLAVEYISKSIADFIKKIVESNTNIKSVNLHEMFTSVNTMFLKDSIEYLIKNKIDFNFVSVTSSKENHELRELYIKNIFKHDINFKKINKESFGLEMDDLLDFMQDDVYNFFVYPCGTINQDIYSHSELSKLRRYLRPNNDFILMDLDILNEKINERNIIISSNLITMQKRFAWLLSKLNLQKHSHDNIFEINSNEGYNYRFLSLNRKIKYSYKIKGEEKSFILEKDTSINYIIIKKYTLDELVALSRDLQYDLMHYAYTKEDSSALAVFTPKKISVDSD